MTPFSTRRRTVVRIRALRVRALWFAIAGDALIVAAVLVPVFFGGE